MSGPATTVVTEPLSSCQMMSAQPSGRTRTGASPSAPPWRSHTAATCAASAGGGSSSRYRIGCRGLECDQATPLGRRRRRRMTNPEAISASAAAGRTAIGNSGSAGGGPAERGAGQGAAADRVPGGLAVVGPVHGLEAVDAVGRRRDRESLVVDVGQAGRPFELERRRRTCRSTGRCAARSCDRCRCCRTPPRGPSGRGRTGDPSPTGTRCRSWRSARSPSRSGRARTRRPSRCPRSRRRRGRCRGWR